MIYLACRRETGVSPVSKARGKGQSKRAPAVVNVRDEGNILDAPLDVVWQFMEWDGHGAAHENTARNFTVRKKTGAEVVCSYETFRGGNWRKITCRARDFPPLGRLVEELEGPYAGTQMVFLYTPVGDRTRLDIIARLVSDVFPEEELERHMLSSFEAAGREDLPYFKDFARKRKSQ